MTDRGRLGLPCPLNCGNNRHAVFTNAADYQAERKRCHDAFAIDARQSAGKYSSMNFACAQSCAKRPSDSLKIWAFNSLLKRN
jgi:hypothetical protein